MRNYRPVVTALFASAMLLLACRPDYPSCEADKDCHDKEFCIARKCQQCRDSADCQQGQVCATGKCTLVAGQCQTNAECQHEQVCVDHHCQACTSDDHCAPPTICHRNRCTNGQRCDSKADCPEGQDCVAGLCASPSRDSADGACDLPSVLFDFNEATLTTEATGRLAKAADCLKRRSAMVRAVGHADPRGTQEYNLALSERRARAVREHLERLGADLAKIQVLPRGALDATGTDEIGWANDRRVDLTWH